MTPEYAAYLLRSRYGLLSLFALGLVIRLALAVTSDGLWFDVSLFRQWSDRLVQHGPGAFYAPGYFVDYPPGYLYVLLLLGTVSHALTGAGAPLPVLKLPAIAADLGVAAVALLIAARLTRNAAPRRSTIPAGAAAAILFNPGLILLSAVWGQVDSILALMVMAGIYVLTTGRTSLVRETGAIGLLAIVIATKPQAVFALPVVAVVLVHRHLPGGRQSPIGALLVLAVRMGLYMVFGFVVITAMFAPFGMRPAEILNFYGSAGSVYPFTSLWAFNIWGVTGFYRPDIGSGAVALASIPAFYAALIVFAVVTIALAARAGRSLTTGVDPAAVAMFGVVAVTCASFALLTRSHERYLYLAVTGLAPFIGMRPLRLAFVALSLCYFLNVHFVYVFFSQHSSPPGDAWTIQPLYDALFGNASDAWQLKVLSAVTATACLAVAASGWRWLERYAADTHQTRGPAGLVAAKADALEHA